MSKKNEIGESLEKLEKIAEWFEAEKEIDVEEGLKKVKEGAELIKDLKLKIKKVENDFEEIRKEVCEAED